MATATVAFMSREDHRKQIELEEARKAGFAPAEVDEDGKEINPHIPQYIASAPWYLNTKRPGLKHQRKRKPDPNYTKSCCDSGAKTFQADKYRKGACENCGAMTHDAKSCMERPRKVGAKLTNKHIAPDEKIETPVLDYAGKHDGWNGCDASDFACARRKCLKERQPKRLQKIEKVAFMSREDHRKQIELEEARKAGFAPAEVDEDGKEINPHIPQYIASAPWYLNTKRPGLKHQRKRKPDPNYTKSCCDSGAKTFQADKYRKGACENCGAMTHDAKSCMERPRKVGAKLTNKHIAPDEKIETPVLDYAGKHDGWNGCDASDFACARRKCLKERQPKRLQKSDQNGEDAVSEDHADEDDLRVDEAKIDESKQMGFAKVEKRVRTTGGGSTGTAWNLRHREDTAKYLLNLDVNSAHYDPKTRSMREGPPPDADPNEKFYEGDNQYRNSGQALEFKELNIYAFDKGQDVHMQAAPSQTEFLYKNYKVMKEKLKSQKMETILEKYGNAANEDKHPRELLLGQSERQVEYDCAGRIIKGQEAAVPRSKYEEDVFINNHITVWGSWRKDHQWGYKCCKQTIRNSYCTGAAGIEAAEAASDLVKANIARKEAIEDDSTPVEEKGLATWGTDVPDDLVLDEKLLADVLKKEDQRKREEKDERKRKYNVCCNDEDTAEEMEAYRMKKVHHDDPMKNLLH